MAPNRKRRLDQRDPTPDDSADESPPPQRRRRSPCSSSTSSSASATSSHSAGHTGSNSTTSLAKKLVRLALSTEYSRTPLRRTDISTKIFANQPNTRNFKAIFDLAQADLQSKFGMQLVELPGREKFDLKSRRHLLSQSTKATAAGSSSKSWILVSTLPPAYKTNPAITTPTNAGGSQTAEAAYTALYTFVVSVIYLNGGALPDAKLERYLKRINAETYTSVGATEKVLARMVKEGYVEKRRDTSTGEELVEWVVGPRGKVEVGVKGVTGLVKSVYGFPGAAGGEDGLEGDGDEEEEDLERKLRRSLGIRENLRGPRIVVDGAGAGAGGGAGGGAEARDSDAEAEAEQPTTRRRGRPRRAAATEEQSDDDA